MKFENKQADKEKEQRKGRRKEERKGMREKERKKREGGKQYQCGKRIAASFHQCLYPRQWRSYQQIQRADNFLDCSISERKWDPRACSMFV